MKAILANPATPLILAAMISPVTMWAGWTGFRMSLHPTADTDETS